MPDTTASIAPRRWIDRVRIRCAHLLFSSRPRWATMPGFVADNFTDNLLFCVSALEHHGVHWTAHFGTLLGAARLQGVCPWDEDADIFAISESTASLRQKLGSVFEEHGFLFIHDARDFYWVRQNPWWAGQGHIGLECLIVAPEGTPEPTGLEDPVIAERLLLPLRRLGFYGSYLWAPDGAEALIERLYGSTGTKDEMQRHVAPAIRPETIAFWRSARPIDGALDWPAISARFMERRTRRPYRHLLTFPWWWFNGAYNLAIRSLSAWGKAHGSVRP